MIPSGPLAYAAIFLAAMIEGEVVFAAAAVMVSAGTLHPLPVIVAGALGAAAGDQLYFYALRGRIQRWFGRWRPIAARQEAVVSRVRQHQNLMILAIRFSPGLRIAIAAACAYAGVPPIRFSVLNLLSALVWAGILLSVIAWAGPSALTKFGLSGWRAALIPALVILLAVWIASRRLAANRA